MAAQVWPLLVFLGVFLAVALAWFARSGDSVPAEMAWSLFKAATLGVVGSYALHESAHVVVLKRIPTVTHLRLDRALWRTSVRAEGTLTARQIVAVAMAGPLACVMVGGVLWVSALDRALAWWFLAHGLLLLPFFGDGRSIIRGLRASWSRPAKENDPD
ncbi:hypothetical protein [Actinomadura litoris]|uniref:hypothetical protein n=1 Tax=Actinomadura litoris TaxID=2678616 RepID=UPI001FA765A2|nr:hypothetical protein [Actinomadura litoris]